MKSAYPYLPGGATSATGQHRRPERGRRSLHLLSPLAGGALLLAYGLVFAILGSMLTVRRDVT